MKIKKLIKLLSEYPPHTRLDFVLLGEDWEDACQDTELKIKGIVGSGTMDCDDTMYLEIGLEQV